MASATTDSEATNLPGVASAIHQGHRWLGATREAARTLRPAEGKLLLLRRHRPDPCSDSFLVEAKLDVARDSQYGVRSPRCGRRKRRTTHLAPRTPERSKGSL